MIGKHVKLLNSYTGTANKDIIHKIDNLGSSGIWLKGCKFVREGNFIILEDEYNIKKLKKERVAIQCLSLEEFKKVSNMFDYRWNTTLNSIWRVYEEKTCINTTGVGYCNKSWYQSEGFKIVLANEFIIANQNLLSIKKEKENEIKENNTEKRNNMEKPKIFIIEGPAHNLISFKEDLKLVGYTVNVDRQEIKAIVSNYTKYKKKEEFRQIHINDGSLDLTHSSYNNHVRFKLPEQYGEALNFCKEQINSPYWEEERRKTLQLGSNKLDVTVYKNGNVVFIAGSPYMRTKKEQIVSVSDIEILFALFNMCGTKLMGHEVSLEKDLRFIRIGCLSENNMFSLNEIEAVINAHKELNK